MDPSSSSTPQVKKEILACQVALDQGDYQTVRKKLRTLTNPGFAVPEDLKPDVERLERTVKNDPAGMVLVIACACFFLLVCLQYVF
jgi:hypothetical protein